ncbi:MAG TPA: dihydropteroate synthase [Acidobacteria bacterium]|nr:dihydropteroate synthase [Acidobacteriota bacterium]
MSPVAGDPRLERCAGAWSSGLPAIMGIVNCTPDSFSDGGRYLDPGAAIRHGLAMVEEGAAILDIGGESTRPGAEPVPAKVELERVLPVIEGLRACAPGVAISIDTSKAAVAARALEAGADLVNDVTAASDPAMLNTVAAASAGIVLMHMRGSPRDMQADTRYDHVVAEVHGFLRERAAAALAAGIPGDLVWLDPGIGFGKDDDGNLALLAALPDLAALGHPVVAGPSRKSFIGRLAGAPTGERLPGTLAALQPALACRRAVVRVHEVAPVRQYLTIARGIMAARSRV